MVVMTSLQAALNSASSSQDRALRRRSSACVALQQLHANLSQKGRLALWGRSLKLKWPCRHASELGELRPCITALCVDSGQSAGDMQGSLDVASCSLFTSFPATNLGHAVCLMVLSGVRVLFSRTAIEYRAQQSRS